MIKHLCAFVLLSTIAIACGGPNYHFDPSPAPDWTRQQTVGKGQSLTAVGSAPATIDAQRDTELASRDAKTRLSQFFSSQVDSRSSDWSVSANSGKFSKDQQVVAQNVQVRSNITIDDASVLHSYRDEATKSQYVEIEVDRTAWLERLHGRVDHEIAALKRDIATVQDALTHRHILGGYKAIMAGRDRGKAVEPDVIVLDLLDPKAGVGETLTGLKGQLNELTDHVRTDFGYSVQLSNVPADISPNLQANIDTFLQGLGFTPARGNSAGLKIAVTVSEQFVQTAQVANRTEQVHAAMGELKVFEPDGAEVPELAINLGRNQTEQDANQDKARRKALGLAADSVVSKFRSAFRKHYMPDNG